MVQADGPPIGRAGGAVGGGVVTVLPPPGPSGPLGGAEDEG